MRALEVILSSVRLEAELQGKAPVEETENKAVCLHAADEGVGILAVVTRNNQLLLCVLSQLMNFALALWLNPPTSGARIITSILCNPVLHEAW